MEAPSLTTFIEDMITRAGMTNLPDEFRRKYVEQLAVQLQERVGLRALRELDEEQLANFEALVKDKGNAAQVFEFFQNHVRDFPQKMAAVMQEFSDEFVEHSKKVREQLHTA